MTTSNMKELSAQHSKKLLHLLEVRFQQNSERHKGLDWTSVLARLEKNNEKLWSLSEMERTGGEPDVLAFDAQTNEFIFYDFSAESPAGRRSLCYDREALESRKEFKPAYNVLDMAADMGIELLTETEYRKLQQLGKFDTKTSSWITTPPEIRQLGGALFSIGATIRYLFITTVQNRITPPGVFAVRFVSE